MPIQMPYMPTPQMPQPAAPGPQQGVLPPELLERLVAAQRAKANADAASEEAKRAHELRGYKPAQGQGYGNVYEAAPLHGHIGQLMQALGREYKYDAASEQAKALRGAVDPTAEQELDFRVADERLKLAQQYARNNQPKEDSSGGDGTVTYDYKEGAKLYTNDETGENAWLARGKSSEGEGVYINTQTQQPVAFGPEWRKYDDQPVWLKGVPKKFQEEARGSRKLYSELTTLTGMARNLTDKQRAQIDRPGLFSTKRALTPEAFEQYITYEALDLDPEVRKFLARAAQIDAGIRNKLFGAALTRYEGSFANSFLQSADGVRFADRMDRIDNIVGELKAGGKAITGGDRDLFSDLEPYFRYKAPRKLQEQKAPNVEKEGLWNVIKGQASDFVFGSESDPPDPKSLIQETKEYFTGETAGGKPRSVAEFEAMTDQQINNMPEAEFIRRANEMNEYYKGLNANGR